MTVDHASTVLTPCCHTFGYWHAVPHGRLFTNGTAWRDALARVNDPLWVVRTHGQGLELAAGGQLTAAPEASATDNREAIGLVSACPPTRLGDPGFTRAHGLQYPLFMGSMANGISSVAAAEALARAGMLGFYGAAGQALAVVEQSIDELSRRLDTLPFGCNLIHSPNEADLEAAIVDLYLRRNVHLIEASAYLNLTLPVVRYRVAGIHRDAAGRIVTPNRIIAKVSRVEVATRFFSPPPDKMLAELVASRAITAEQAALAAQIPMAEDVTAEADSGGHTDNRPLVALVPTLVALRDRMQAQFRYAVPPRVGCGGGIATPASAAAAFALGAAYLVIGSVAQSCRESGTSPVVRQMLVEAQQADTAMAPAADMFEMGVTVQVLKRGTMFAMRAAKLYEVYRSCDSLEAIPAATRATLEKQFFQAPLEEIWRQTREFFTRRGPHQVARAEREPKHRMALVFRWYLGQASRWAINAVPERKVDYQVWCGPAMGAFNEWVKGSCLEAAPQRDIVSVAMNLLWGAAVQLRITSLRTQGIDLPAEAAVIAPRPLPEITALLAPGVA